VGVGYVFLEKRDCIQVQAELDVLQATVSRTSSEEEGGGGGPPMAQKEGKEIMNWEEPLWEYNAPVDRSPTSAGGPQLNSTSRGYGGAGTHNRSKGNIYSHRQQEMKRGGSKMGSRIRSPERKI